MSKKSRNRGWTKEDWLTYKDWSERWQKWAMNWFRVRNAVAEMESRED